MAYMAKDFGRRGLQHDTFSLIPLLVGHHMPHPSLIGSYDYVLSLPSPHLAQEAIECRVSIKNTAFRQF